MTTSLLPRKVPSHNFSMGLNDEDTSHVVLHNPDTIAGVGVVCDRIGSMRDPDWRDSI